MLDIKSNRGAKKYSLKIQCIRLLWGIVRPLFRMTPRPLNGIRIFILRCFGAKIGKFVYISNSAVIYFPWNLLIDDYSALGDDVYVYNLGLITIGKYSTVSHKAHLCAGTHDYTAATLPLVKPPIILGNNVWVCANSFIGPNVEVQDGAIVGAASVVMRDVLTMEIVAGNPAKFVKKRVMK